MTLKELPFLSHCCYYVAGIAQLSPLFQYLKYTQEKDKIYGNYFSVLAASFETTLDDNLEPLYIRLLGFLLISWLFSELAFCLLKTTDTWLIMR